MLFRLFAKEPFDLINQELDTLFKTLAVSKLKIRTQAATYSKPYTYRAEGCLNGHCFVLSLHHSELKKKLVKEQMELIVYCKNPNWVVLQAHQGQPSATKKKTLGLEKVQSLELLNAHQLFLESNQKNIAKNLLNDDLCHQMVTLAAEKFEHFKLERNRLYYKTAWLPNSPTKKAMLRQALKLGVALCKQIDQ